MSKKKIFTTILVASLMAIPLVAYAEGETAPTSGSPITGTAPAANDVANQVSSQTPVTPTSAPAGTTTPAPTSGQTTAPTPNAGESTSTAPAGQTAGGAKVSYKDVETKLTVVKHNWVNYNTYSQVKKEYQNQ